MGLSARLYPLLGYRKMQTDTTDLQKHLSTKHNNQERSAQHAALGQAGWDSETCEILCPICSKKVPDESAFVQPIIDAHAAINKHHYFLWLDHFNSTIRRKSRRFLVTRCVFGLPYNFCPFPDFGKVHISCPACTFILQDAGSYGSGLDRSILQHKSLFVNSPELIEHREVILKLFPDFGVHSVFDDIRNQSQSSE